MKVKTLAVLLSNGKYITLVPSEEIGLCTGCDLKDGIECLGMVVCHGREIPICQLIDRLDLIAKEVAV